MSCSSSSHKRAASESSEGRTPSGGRGTAQGCSSYRNGRNPQRGRGVLEDGGPPRWVVKPGCLHLQEGMSWGDQVGGVME